MVLQGPSFGDIYYLEGEPLVLGSNPFQADIVVRDVEVEPEHVQLYSGGPGYVVKDLSTGKPTFINGDRVAEPLPVRSGDRIFVGNSILEFVDQDPLKEQFHKKIQRMINQDYLTGLLAKNRFDERFEQTLEICQENESILSVLMADIDNLKKINDSYGHLLGEFVVGEIGRIIHDCLESEEFFASRFGGDEYQAILPGLTKDEATEIAEEIRHSIEEFTFEHEGAYANPTLSLGVASYPEDGDNRDKLTHSADKALYRAKHAGGNSVSQ
ncbi:MAG: diguanylate cyclase [Rubrobacteraceae bacterium]